jgi:hypothetical protein
MNHKGIINELVTIGNWAKSCKTLEQLDIVTNFFHDKCEVYNKHFNVNLEIMLHIGIVTGILLSIRKLRFSKK